MKRWMRKAFAMALVLVMLPVCGVTEDITSGMIEPEVGPAESVGAEGLFAEPEGYE